MESLSQRTKRLSTGKNFTLGEMRAAIFLGIVMGIFVGLFFAHSPYICHF